MAMIEVKYSCHKCGVKRAGVHVVARSPRENVVQFVERAALQCAADHDSRSPSCVIDKLDEFMIPVEENGDTGIGEAPTRQ